MNKYLKFVFLTLLLFSFINYISAADCSTITKGATAKCTAFGMTYEGEIKCPGCARPTFADPSDYIVEVGRGGAADLGVSQFYRNYPAKRVFCLKRKGGSPALGAGDKWDKYPCKDEYTFTMASSYVGKENNLKAAIGYVIDDFNKSANNYVQYANHQKVIWALLYTYAKGQENVSTPTGYESLYSNAVSVFKKYGSESLSVSNFKLVLSNGNWVGEATITNSNLNTVEISSLKKDNSNLSQYATINGNKVYISIPQNQLSNGDTVSLELLGKSSYSFVDAKNCASNKQPIGEIATIPKSVTKTATATGTIDLYTVQYDANGGDNAPATQYFVMNSGDSISSQIPIRKYYSFNYWTTKWREEPFYPGDTIPNSWGNFTLTAQWVPYGKIKVHKVRSDGVGLINKDVKFGAYSDASCNNLVSTFEGTTNSQGYVEGSVAPGTYWIKELSIDSDIYKKSDECVYIGRVDLDTTVSSDYTNVTYCESDYNSNKTIANRLLLYNNYGFNNLLNFNKTELKDVCTTYNPKYIRETSCLYSNQNSEVFEEESQVEKNFSSTDLSSYNETIDINSANGQGYKGYCRTEFFVENYFYLYYQENKKAGQLIIQGEENNFIVVGNLTKTCYVYKGYYEPETYPQTIVTTQAYSDYIDSMSLDGKKLRHKTKKDVEEENVNNKKDITKEELVLKYQGEENEFYKYELIKSINYYLNEVCVNKISGRVYENSSCKEVCESPSSFCKFLGYGVLSNFNDALEINPSFNFSITPGDMGAQIFDFENDTKRGDNKISKSNTSCSYSIEPEIVEYPESNSNGDLQLEFRIIDTNNPFLDREPNTNWKNETKINDVIIDGYNNSYNITGKAPKYKITLTPSDIQKIRAYNNGTEDYSESHPYDDYEISCNNLNNKCGNAFLKEFGITKSN